jgi:inner membrane protein
MLVFGHAGITLGIASLLAGVTASRYSDRNRKVREDAGHWHPSQAAVQLNYNENRKVSWFESLAYHVDLRLLLIGSLMPDIIDKPLRDVFLRHILHNNRTFGHTLFFLAIITAIGIYLRYRHRKNAVLLGLSFGTFTHLVFDQMWREPHTLLWPIYGFAFERVHITTWEPNIFYALPELAGAAVLLWFAQSLLRRRRALAFLKYGKA